LWVMVVSGWLLLSPYSSAAEGWGCKSKGCNRLSPLAAAADDRTVRRVCEESSQSLLALQTNGESSLVLRAHALWCSIRGQSCPRRAADRPAA
jgi:hypothetical protein